MICYFKRAKYLNQFHAEKGKMAESTTGCLISTSAHNQISTLIVARKAAEVKVYMIGYFKRAKSINQVHSPRQRFRALVHRYIGTFAH